ncbi:MAG TPA: prolyl oligopeptidase family serine peptidase, partial [Smithellaceae bacterium]|nr:prolyl oligopeptidase family serine peptidase [Smithellaceae bacterium]
MKRTLLLATMLAVFFSANCLPADATALMRGDGRASTSEKDISPAKCRMTPEILWGLGRVGDPQISPDLTKVLFSVKRYDIALNKGKSELYLMNLDGSERNRLTDSGKDESAAQWRPDGKKIGFVLAGQICEMDPDGKNIKKLTDLKNEISGFLYSPQMDRVLFVSPVAVPKVNLHLYEGLDKSSGRIINDLMYRHWDSWCDGINHIFIADYGPEGINNVTDIMAGELWEAPLAPFGGLEQISWSPDGKTIAYASRKKKGRDYALSTNSDIYLYDVATKQTTNLTEGMKGYDTNPLFSPDGSKIAWLSMERDGYEADENRLFVYDRQTKIKTLLTAGFDQDVSSFVWSADGRFIYFISNHHGADQLYRMEPGVNAIKKITQGAQTFSALKMAGSNLIALHSSFDNPDEIHLINPVSGSARDISRINQTTMEKLSLGAVQRRWVKTTDNKKMLTWVLFPPHFNPGRNYPALLYCVGGPEISIYQGWSYRWNLQVLAAQGYVIIAPNRRGATGFGRQWKEGVLQDWGGRPMQDLLSAVDELKKEPW